jgi:hypothetical protein
MKFRALTVTMTVLFATALSAAAEGPRIGQVKTVGGEVMILRDSARLPVKPGDPVYTKDIVQTGEHGSIGISFVDNSVFSTGPESQIGLDEPPTPAASCRIPRTRKRRAAPSSKSAKASSKGFEPRHGLAPLARGGGARYSGSAVRILPTRGTQCV